MRDKIIEFFKTNPDPDDDKLHSWAEGKGLNVHEVETNIYELVTEYIKLISGGKSNEKGVTEKDVDSSELSKGIEVEKEHMGEGYEDMAKKIALDHLSEIPDYYTRLKKMEDEAKTKTASYYELGYKTTLHTYGII
jgi:hypothetical protein